MADGEYLPRVLDSVINRTLSYKSCVYLKGLKYTGKTTTCEQFSKTKFDLSLKRQRDSVKLALESDPSIIFNFQKPIFSDEVQKYTTIWNELKANTDENKGRPNQFILSGSTIIRESEEGNQKESKSHTGTSRIKKVTMRPLSLY